MKIQQIENPRKEAEDHYYNPKHTALLDLGLKPHYLNDKTLEQMMQFVMRYKDRIAQDQICRNVKWA